MTSRQSATYSPGSWVAASSASAWLLVDLGLDDPKLTDCWTALSGDGADLVLDVLLRGGLAALPGFALVVSHAAGTRVLARHPAIVTCRHGGDEPIVVAGAEGRTWTDIELPAEYDEITLSSGSDADGPLRLPMAHGITPAGLLTVGRPSAPKPVAAPPPTFEEAPVLRTPAVESSVAAPPPTAGSATDQTGGETEKETVDEPDAAAGSSYYGRLLGATVDRDALLAELADDEDDDPSAGAGEGAHPSDAPGHTAIWQPDTQPEEPNDQDHPASVATPELPIAEDTPTPVPTLPGDVIDGVPWETVQTREPASPPAEASPSIVAPRFSAPSPVGHRPPPAPVVVPPTPVAEPPSSPIADATGAPETEVRTVNRAELLKSLAAPAMAGPTVMAVRCPRSHLTSAYSTECRVCGETIADQVPTEEQRPALGRLVLSTGETVILDRDVILGRAPESAEDDPALRPNLVRLTDSGEVSRMHVRITLDGWQPLLRDLGSSNGTTLTLSSSSPQQLRPQEDYVLEPGCEVSLADVVSFRFDVTE